MKYDGIFLGIQEASFTKDGEDIAYYVLHAWDPIAFVHTAIKLPARLLDEVKGAGVKFGDKFQTEVELKTNDKGRSALSIVRW